MNYEMSWGCWVNILIIPLYHILYNIIPIMLINVKNDNNIK